MPPVTAEFYDCDIVSMEVLGVLHTPTTSILTSIARIRNNLLNFYRQADLLWIHQNQGHMDWLHLGHGRVRYIYIVNR